MKLLRILIPLVLLGMQLHAQEQRFPSPVKGEKPVNDFAEVLSPQEEEQLNRFLTGYADTTSTQIVIVTVGSLNDEDPNLYAAELGEQWGVGRQGADNGLIFLVAVDDRQMAIQNGYGLEPYLTDAKTKLIIENHILPEFRNGDYFAGIREGTVQIVNLLQGKFEGQPGGKTGEKSPWSFLPFLLIIGLFFFFFRGRNRNGPRGGYRSGGIWLGGIPMGGGLGGGGGGLGGGGGFSGGFGGGSFGGGGASGSW